MSDSRSKGQNSGGGGGKAPTGANPSRGRWRSAARARTIPVILYGLAHGAAGAGQPAAPHPASFGLSETRARRLARRQHRYPRTPKSAARLIDQRLGRCRAPGLLAEADPLLAGYPIRGAGRIVLVLDQITIRTMSGHHALAAAVRVKAIVTTARHSPEATGVLAKAASGRLELVPLVRVQNSGARAHRVERPRAS